MSRIRLLARARAGVDAAHGIAAERSSDEAVVGAALRWPAVALFTETEDAERRSREFKQLTEYFVNALNVEEVIAQLLVTEGFTSVDEVAYVDLAELAAIQGFDESIAEALHERAEAYLAEQEEVLRAEAAQLGIGEDLLAFGPLGICRPTSSGITKSSRPGAQPVINVRLVFAPVPEHAEAVPGVSVMSSMP